MAAVMPVGAGCREASGEEEQKLHGGNGEKTGG